MSAKDKLHTTELYLPTDPEVFDEQLDCLEQLYDFNNTRPHELEKRTVMLKEMFAEFGQGSYIEPPLHASWAGKNVHFGKKGLCEF